MFAKLFALVNVRDVYLNGGYPGRVYSIPYRHAGMSVSGRINNNRAKMIGRFLNPSDQLALIIRLSNFHLDPQLFRQRLDLLVDLFQPQPPIDFRLPLAEKIQVGTIEYQHSFLRCHEGFLGRSKSGPIYAPSAPRISPGVKL